MSPGQMLEDAMDRYDAMTPEAKRAVRESHADDLDDSQLLMQAFANARTCGCCAKEYDEPLTDKCSEGEHLVCENCLIHCMNFSCQEPICERHSTYVPGRHMTVCGECAKLDANKAAIARADHEWAKEADQMEDF